MRTKFEVKFNPEGFIPGVDVTEEEWAQAVNETVALHNAFADIANRRLDQINDIWNHYEGIKEMESALGGNFWTCITQKNMDIDDNTSYNDWVARWYKEMAEVVNGAASLSKLNLEGYIFRDDDAPVFGTRFRRNKNWTINLTLKEVAN